MHRLLPGLLACASCAFDRTGGSSANLTDASPPDATPDAGTLLPTHLLLSEVCAGPDSLEFIEILNPTCLSIDLRTYYLADQRTYPLLPAWGSRPPLPGTQNAVLRFPPGSILESGAAAVIAHDGTAFAAAFGGPADFAIINPGGSTPMEVIAYRSAPDMLIANSGEPIALFEWDGARDLVRDVDIVIAGEAPALSHQLLGKQDVAPDGVDGPDADAIGTFYHPDLVSMPAMAARDATTGSYQRIAFEAGFETAEGGNGTGGHDETSEDTRMTWEQQPGSPPTPGSVPPALTVSCTDE
jgi:hypothetical protein